HQLVDQPCPARLVIRVAQGDRGEAALQPGQMLRPPELAPAVDRDDLVDPVPEEEAAIEHGDPCLLQRRPCAGQPDGLCSHRTRSCLIARLEYALSERASAAASPRRGRTSPPVRPTTSPAAAVR